LATALPIHKKTYVKCATELHGTVPSKSAKQKVSNVGACFQNFNYRFAGYFPITSFSLADFPELTSSL